MNVTTYVFERRDSFSDGIWILGKLGRRRLEDPFRFVLLLLLGRGLDDADAVLALVAGAVVDDLRHVAGDAPVEHTVCTRSGGTVELVGWLATELTWWW